MKRFLFLAFAIALSSAKSFAQGEIPVDMYTGTPHIQIPVGGVVSRDLSDQAALVYNTRGMKLGETAGHYGIGWDLNTGGSVSREVRGLPDDYPAYGGDPKRGWLNTRQSKTIPVSQEIAAFTNTSDLSVSNCSDEQTDYSALHNFDLAFIDSEPDIFSFSVGGYSGKFVFDNSPTPQVRLIPFQDLKIVPSLQPVTNRIYGFTITTNTGIVYTLNSPTYETRQTTKFASQSTVEYVKSPYELYRNYYGSPLFSYGTDWELTNVLSPGGDQLRYIYNTETFTINDTIRAVIKKYNTTEYSVENLYVDQRTINRTYLNQIYSYSAGTSMVLNYDVSTNLLSNIQMKDKRASLDQLTDVVVKQYDFTYTSNASGRAFLLNVKETGGTDAMPAYKLDYFFDNLPSMYSKAKDFWGYYNGKKNTHLAPTLYVYPSLPPSERYRIYPMPSSYTSTSFVLPGADRVPDSVFIQIGSLKSITYPAGGASILKYEPNLYYDSIAGQNFYGGGLRIKSMTYYDGMNPSTKVIKKFTYENASGASSGRIIQRPTFALPVYEYRNPQNGAVESYLSRLEEPNTLWDYFTTRSEIDLASVASRNESVVGYKEVKVSRPGSGYVKFEFHMPGTFGFQTAGDWNATQNKIARSTDCNGMGVIDSGGSFMFPYAPNPNFDYERGRVWRKREYSEAGILVRETQTTYQFLYKAGTSPAKVWGLYFERLANSNSSVFLFGKYYWLTETIKPVAMEQVTTYDEASLTKNNTQKAEYFYESTQHKQLTRSVQTAADGTIYQTRIKYPLDYTTSSTSDKASEMIALMKSSFRNGTPIESYQTVKRTGDAEKIIGGSILKFNDFGTSKILPQYQLKWHGQSPLLSSSYTPSYINGAGVFTPPAGYDITNTWLEFDTYGNTISSRGMDSIPSTQLWGFNNTIPVASIVGALNGQFAFSDFETTTASSFDLKEYDPDGDNPPSYNPVVTPGRTGVWRAQITTQMSKVLTKAEDTYKLSGWWATNFTSMTVHVTIKNAAKTQTYLTQNFTVSPADPDATFEYFEKEIPIDNALQSFYVELYFEFTGLKSPTGISGLDDVAFYPSSAQLVSSTYTFPFGSEATSQGNKTGYTVYDGLGRVKYIQDRNRHILQKNTYHFATN